MALTFEQHKARILQAIRVEEAKRDTRECKPPKRVWKRSYARKRVRFDTLNIGEMQNARR